MEASEATTEGIRVRVVSEHRPDLSDPARGRWMFAYTVEITNLGDVRVQLVHRHWEITDGDGDVAVVDGPGVVGEQPWLAPGATFAYTSGAPLTTSMGQMEGSYGMRTEDGRAFSARIAPFALVVASMLN
jgi:ApaG protein